MWTPDEYNDTVRAMARSDEEIEKLIDRRLREAARRGALLGIKIAVFDLSDYERMRAIKMLQSKGWGVIYNDGSLRLDSRIRISK